MLKRDGEEILIINTLKEKNTLILFIYKIVENEIAEVLRKGIEQIVKREGKNKIYRVITYLRTEKEKDEFYGDLEEFEVEVRYRRYIRIEDKMQNVILLARYM